MTQILLLDPTIQKQHSHITYGFFIQIFTSLMAFFFIQAEVQGFETKQNKTKQPNNLHPARKVQTSLLRGCTKILSLLPV